MRAQGWGKIVNVSSMGGRFTFPGGGVYHASKHALEAPSDALRFEVGGFGIDVIAIEPGLIRTRFSDVIASDLGDSTAVDEPYGEFNRGVGGLAAGLRARIPGPARRAAGGGRGADRGRPRSPPAARPVYGHTVGSRAAHAALAPARRGVGSHAPLVVPESRHALTT
jgi:NAD(P)-dependent dehydrogenase (short-subunit alcohol dehydrogenase family)